MIGIDTNILLRILLNDDPAQAQSIEQLLAEHAQAAESVHISDIVLVEAVWTLGTSYRLKPAAVLGVLRALLAEPAYDFNDRATLHKAVLAFATSKAGFTDCLIAHRNQAAGCTATATFDRKMRGLGDDVTVI